MKNLFGTIFWMIFLGSNLLLLSGCGQSGALYLPNADNAGTAVAQDAANIK